MKRIDFGNNYALFTDIPDITDEAGEIREDVRSGKMYCALAYDLVNEFESLCKKVPFTVEICEYCCGEDEPHAYAKICKLDAEGCEAVLPTENKPVSCAKAEQFYAARNHNNAHENYMGRFKVKVWMFSKKADASPGDADSRFVENPQAYPLLRLSCMHYYEKIYDYFDEWSTDYMDRPDIAIAKINVTKR